MQEWPDRSGLIEYEQYHGRIGLAPGQLFTDILAG